MPSLIKNLEKKKIPVVALTGWWTGTYGTIKHMENMRFDGWTK